VLLRESQVQPLLLVSRSALDGLRDPALLDSLVESLPTPSSCCWSTTARGVPARLGSKTYYTHCALTRCCRPVPTHFSRLCLAPTPVWCPQAAADRAYRGNPSFWKKAYAPWSRLAYVWRTRRLSPGAAHRELAGARHGTGNSGSAHRPVAAREKWLLQTAAVIGTEDLAVAQAIAELPKTSCNRGLAHLQEPEFLYETASFRPRVYLQARLTTKWPTTVFA